LLNYGNESFIPEKRKVSDIGVFVGKKTENRKQQRDEAFRSTPIPYIVKWKEGLQRGLVDVEVK